MLSSQEEDLERLAEICLSTAKQIKKYLSSNSLPQMTFDQNGPAFFPQTTPEIEHARLDLRAATKRLYDLVSGPDDVLTWHPYHCAHDLNAFRYVQHYKIPSAVPLNSSISYDDLAATLSLDPSQLKQMLRQLIPIHVFTETTPNHVSHTAASRLLLHPGVGSFNAFIAEDTFVMASKQIEALEHFGHGQSEPNRAALNFATGSDLSMFEYYETNPVVRERFSKLMTYMSSAAVMSNAHVASGFDWASLPAGSVVVDVAGNAGHCAIPIAETNPGVRIVVQDLPKMVARASDPATSVIPEPLRPRFEFMAHNFYAEQPVRHAAVYFLRMILHDYSDAYALKILRAIVPSMGPESRIVIMDQVTPPTMGVVPPVVERMIGTTNLQMMLLSNAKERNAAEWADLVHKAGDGLLDSVFGGDGKGAGKSLGIKNIQTPVGSVMSLIEVGFVDEVDGKMNGSL